MSFSAMAIEDALRHPQLVRVHYTPQGEPRRTDADGFELLSKAAQDIPVSLMRLEAGGVIGQEIRVVKSWEIAPANLVPGVTCYAFAFKRDRVPHLVVVARSEIRVPAPSSAPPARKTWTSKARRPSAPALPPDPAPPPSRKTRRGKRGKGRRK